MPKPRKRNHHSSEEDYEESESASGSSEYDPESDGEVSRIKTRNKNQRHKMHIDHTEDDEDDDDDDDVDHVFEEHDEAVLPKPVVYLQYDDTYDRIAPDQVLHEVLNDTINDTTACDDPSFYLKMKAMNVVIHKIDQHIAHRMEAEDGIIFDQIVKFAQDAYTPKTPLNAMNFMWSLHQHVIPTAMLMCGQNVSDHALHFEHLYHKLKTNVSPLIVRFTANDLKKNGSFASRVYDIQRHIVESLFKALNQWQIAKPNKKRNSPTNTRKTRVSKAEITEYLDVKRCLKLPTLKSIKNEILRTFVIWYFRFARDIDKYWTANADIPSCLCLNHVPKIVLMIDSIEQWSPNILTSLIYTLHGMVDNYREITHTKSTDHIPFVLVMGVSTTEDLLSRMIECDAVRLLSVEQFHFEASQPLYMSLAEEILIESSPILFDESILNKLLNHCQLNDYSVSRFKEQIRYLLMAYFRSTPCCQYAAYLMDYDANQSKNERMERLKQWWLDDEEEHVTELLEQAELNGDDETVLFEEYLDETYHVYERYREALKVFKMITDHLDFKWSSTEIIAKLQNKELLFKHLRCRVGADRMCAEERAMFKPRIQHFEDCHAIYKILEAETEIFDADFAKQAAEQYKRITTQLEQKAPSHHQAAEDVPVKRKKLNAQQKRSALKRQLTKQTNKGVFDKGRRNLFDLLKAFIEKHLKPMSELPLNEIFVYKNEKQFSRDMLPPTNSEIRNRYENYRCYLQRDDTEEIEPEAMSCIYDVYNEIDGLYLNLHDAYVAFRARFADCSDHEAMDVDNETRREEKKQKKRKRGKKKRNSKEEMSADDEDNDNNDNNASEKEKKMQIQFRMGIDDLQFCGFVKAAPKRKKETLMKMADLV